VRGISRADRADRNRRGQQAGSASAKPAVILALNLFRLFVVARARLPLGQRHRRIEQAVPERVDHQMKKE
jgi:hypothetical protein